MADEKEAYLAEVEKTRPERMKWFHDARFGMFVHWGLYAQIGRNEWAMNIECIPKAEYEKLAETWKPKPRPMREWCKLARKAGMKYMVMTTKHHEGFCLWDTKMTDYNAVARGPKRDLVREYVEACREFGLKIGFYYSLMDWHHPDGATCAKDEAARRRFCDFTYGCVRELMSNYGKIDVLWYDVSWPLDSPEKWESLKMNKMARALQPHILINDRSQIPEDFSTPEGHVKPADAGRGWEACMTFNDTSWGYMPSAAPDAVTARDILKMLNTAAANEGNLLLNIGPAPDGSVPEDAVAPLTAVGKWIAANKEAVIGTFDRGGLGGTACGWGTVKGSTVYFWCKNWPGTSITIGGYTTKLKKATLLASKKALKIEQKPYQIKLSGMPKVSPDKFAGITVIKLEFASKPEYVWGATTMNLEAMGIK
ncbi:MAG: alpha-L-fucosidase [Planctomycetota bacterium]|nr:alpha-L-fucosidase [Planctomycetota bacterium]